MDGEGGGEEMLEARGEVEELPHGTVTEALLCLTTKTARNADSSTE